MEKNTIDRNLLLVTPVKKYSLPKYPSLLDAKNNPDLLRKMPSRWQRNAKVIAAAGLLGTIMLTSCGIANADNRNLLNVAPIFKHGSGSGAFGCVMIVPSVFLSEQEALAIIRSVAESGGLSFGTRPPDYVATKNEVRDHYIGNGEVRLNYYDSEKQVAVAYIPLMSAEMIHKDLRRMSVSSFSASRLAEMTVEDLAKQEGDITVGVFYEPGNDRQNEELNLISNISEPYNRATYNEYKAKMKDIMEENLRRQVHDFIEWLQGQGII